MTQLETKEFTNQVFKLIKDAKSREDIEKILDKMKVPNKNRMKSEDYPQIKFSIAKSEIDLLVNEGKIEPETLTLNNDLSSKLDDPLSKLLYSIVWKNGDFKKIKHIVKGVKEVGENNENQNDALVFYQFGKYLTKNPGEPIIDQHVIRAFAVYKSKDDSELESLKKLDVLKKKHKQLINDYINWLKGDELSVEIKAIPDYAYGIDKILFATGKSIKFKKPKNK